MLHLVASLPKLQPASSSAQPAETTKEMPARRDTYDSSDDEHRHSYSYTPPSKRYPRPTRDSDKHRLSRTRRTASSTVARPEKERDVDYDDRTARRHYKNYDERAKNEEEMYHREARRSGRRGRSLHNEDDAEYRQRGDRYRSRTRTRARSEGRLVEAAKAGLVAGVTEAVRVRHDSNRARRAVTAAVSAAAVDAFVSKGDDRHRGRHLVESAVSGLLIDRLANGQSRR